MKTLVAIPCMDTMPTPAVKSLFYLDKGEDVSLSFLPGTLIYDGRNFLSLIAIQEKFDRVMWLDSDMTFPRDTIKRMHAHFDADPDVHMVTGLYTTRRPPVGPTIFSQVEAPLRDKDGNVIKRVHQYKDYPENAFFPVQGCGFGCVMTSVRLLLDVWENYDDAFTPLPWVGEDLSFCKKVTDLGYTIWCDSSIACGHIGQIEYTKDMIFRGDEA